MFKSESTKLYYIETDTMFGPSLKIICVDKFHRTISTIWSCSFTEFMIQHYSTVYDLLKKILANRKNAILNLRHEDKRVRQLCELILRLNRNINRGNKKWKRLQQN